MERHVLIHEAGHAVVADSLGFDVVCIELGHEDGPRCGILSPEHPTPAEHFMLAAYSLAGGQAMVVHGVEPDAGCFADLDFAHAHAEAAYMGDVGDVMERAVLLAGVILRGRWKAVEAIADRLSTGEDMDADDLADILGEREIRYTAPLDGGD